MFLKITNPKSLGAAALLTFVLGISVCLISITDDGSEVKTFHKTKSRKTRSPIENGPQVGNVDKWLDEQDLTHSILRSISPENIKEHHRFLTLEPHVAASSRDEELAYYVHDKLQLYGFDVVKMIPYNVLLTVPNVTKPNSVVLKKSGTEIFRSQYKEKAIHPDDDHPNFIHSFSAFTPAGKAVTPRGSGLVYVNYGTVEDFSQLKELGVDVNGCIAIIRYGKIYRGNKIRHAELAGAIGVLLFSDPEDVAPEGTKPEDVYDKTWWLPGSGMQRGSTFLGNGDPLTPGWPSTEHAYRIPQEEADLHKIPAQPIGYDDARVILEHLSGNSAPENWQGGLANFTYKLGPAFKEEFADVSLELSTHNVMEVMKSYNVMGLIKGNLEPDRYIMIGNHRDAWGFGGADPSSGTAQMLETARVFGEMTQKGWRPRRSLVFNSWGAEEYGLLGSTEWVEENLNVLQERTVTYINTDTCASGPMVDISASPLIMDTIQQLSQMIPGVVKPSKTLYEEWTEYHSKLYNKAQGLPKISHLGAGSDQASFAFYAGIPSADIRFKRDRTKHDITIYPAYHTGFDTFYMVSTFVDPDYKIMQGCGRLASLLLKYFADSNIIPYNISRYSEDILKSLRSSPYIESWRKISDKYDELENAIMRLQNATRILNMELKNQDMSFLEQRSRNDQLMQLDKCFILPEGLPGRPLVRHAIFAPSEHDRYASSGFPGLADLMHQYDELSENETSVRNDQIRKHISDLTIMADRATSLLQVSFEL